ncbi:hypothetical protein BJY52DRAFT_1194323 [Lactarius psammicola]|nr:hypothetical protein BJY52DRAFT_1194323 [Lactarius psammicola]
MHSPSSLARVATSLNLMPSTLNVLILSPHPLTIARDFLRRRWRLPICATHWTRSDAVASFQDFLEEFEGRAYDCALTNLHPARFKFTLTFVTTVLISGLLDFPAELSFSRTKFWRKKDLGDSRISTLKALSCDAFVYRLRLGQFTPHVLRFVFDPGGVAFPGDLILFADMLLYTMRHGYTTAEQSRMAFVLWHDIHKAHVDVRFNARIAADSWRINFIKNGEVDIELPMTSEPPSRATPSMNRKK